MRATSPLLRVLAVLLLACAAAFVPARADTLEKVGVNAAVNTNANGTPPGGLSKKLVIGEDIVHNERVTTDANGQTQILFVDGSSVSVGPSSDLTIDEFVFDPRTGTGKMTLTDLQGAMRFVGGKLSKQEDAVSVHLGTATIGVRGGVFLANTQRGGASNVIFVFGKAVSVSGGSGRCGQQLYRPGFEVSISGPGGCPDSPHLAPPGAMADILLNLDGRNGSHGGATTVPTNATIAASSVPNTISNNVTGSLQQATNNAGPITNPPPPTTSPPQVSNQQTQNAVNNPSPSPQPPQTKPFPDTANISGGLAALGGGNPALGFNNLPTPYSNGSVQNGVLVITVGSDTGSIPLAQGTGTLNGNGTFSPVGPLTGTTFATPDNTFFYANLSPTAHPANTVFVYGGTPVNVSAYAPPSSPQVLAFQIQPDAVLQSPVPFVPNQFGGGVSSPNVSPLFVAVSPSQGFGYQVSGNALPKALQASVAINGQGSAQSSLIMVTVGNIFSEGLPVLNGVAEGTYSANATSPPTLLSTAYITPADGVGNSFYGGNTVSGFVLVPTCCAGPGGDTEAPVAINTQTQQTTSYGFAQPAISTTAPPIASGPQTTRSLTGYAGGIMTASTNGGAPLPYAVTGATAVETDATNLQIAAQIVGTDPFTPGTSGVNSLSLSYGSLSPGGTNARQGYINDNLFGTLESPGGGGSTLNSNGGTANIYLVTASAVPNALANILPSGVTPCSCQFLQWGYWGGQLTTTSDGNTRVDAGAINTWVAGLTTPTNQMPAVGSGSYSGAAIGTVNTGGATYVAAGGFGLNYNFGNNTGNISITNFDNHNYTASVNGTGSTYAGALTGSGVSRQGAVVGSFFGTGANAAAETGGSFNLQSTGGPSYIASGTFAGKLTAPIR